MIKLSPAELGILAFLYKRKGWVDTDTLNCCTAESAHGYDHAAPLRLLGTVAVHIFNIREKLGDGAIISHIGDGYMLGEPGAKYYRAHLAALAAFEAAMR